MTFVRTHVEEGHEAKVDLLGGFVPLGLFLGGRMIVAGNERRALRNEIPMGDFATF